MAPSANGFRPLLRFFAISHGFSWGFWIAAALLGGEDIWASSARWLVYAGGLGPLIAGAVLTYSTEGGAGVRALASRTIDPRRIEAPWLLAALLLPVLSIAVAAGIAALSPGGLAALDAERLGRLAGAPLAFLGFALFVLIFGPVPEEIGWRGYALEALQERWSALTASLLLGAAWALWHAPLFYIAGYYAGPAPDPVLFITAILVHSVLYTWIYNNTDRSVLAVILFHFMINLVGMLVEGELWVEWVRTGFTAALVGVVLVRWGARTLRRGPGAA